MQTDKTILFYNFGAQLGGAEKVLLEYLLKKETANFVVLLNEHGPFYERLVEVGIEVSVIALPEAALSAWTGIRRSQGIFALIRTTRHIPSMLSLVWRIYRFVNERQIDVIVSNSMKSHIIAALLARFCRAKVIWRFHDIVQTEYASNRISPWLVHVLRSASRHVDRISCVSKAVKDSVIKHKFSPGSIGYFYNGMQVPSGETKRPVARDGELGIGWIGRFTRWKGIEEFIGIISRLFETNMANMYEHIQVYIAGGSVYEQAEYEEFIRSKISPVSAASIKFLGFIENVGEFYEKVDIVMHTSIAPDPLPTVIIEAGLRGKIVIASPLGGPQEMIEHGKSGLLMNLDDGLDKCAETLVRVVDNVDTLWPLGKRLQQNIMRDFSLDGYVSRFDDLINEMNKR